MDPKRQKTISKFMSLVLRHEPELIGLTLDSAGWVDVATLIEGCNRQGLSVTRTDIERVVAENDKQRFAFSEDGRQIRPNQGHSVTIDLELPLAEPPKILFHGTAIKNLEVILQQGLTKQARQHVHLSLTRETALAVGQRHGKPVLLEIQSAAMHRDGIPFYLSANGVWLTDCVPAKYLAVAK